MSITRSSIPVCIRCSAPRASRRVPPLSVTAAHSSPVPPAIVRDLPVPSPNRRCSSGPPCPPGGRSSQLLKKTAFHPLFPFLPIFFFYFLFFFHPVLLSFLLCLTHPFPSHPNFCHQDAFQHRVAFAALLYRRVVDKTPGSDASRTTRHPKVSSVTLEEEHHHLLECKVKTFKDERGKKEQISLLKEKWEAPFPCKQRSNNPTGRKAALQRDVQPQGRRRFILGDSHQEEVTK